MRRRVFGREGCRGGRIRVCCLVGEGRGGKGKGKKREGKENCVQ